jgi:hypothetical protein
VEVYCRIVPYLEGKGYKLKREGNVFKMSSPFSADSEPSFVIFPKTDSFYDYSNKFGGSFERLVERLDGKGFTPTTPGEHITTFKTKPFSLNNYNRVSFKERKKILDYAASRKITNNFITSRVSVSKEER